MVDYRGPQFLKSFCHRWGIDLYDRIIEVHLTERSTAVTEMESLRSLKFATFSAGLLVPPSPFGPNEVGFPQLERPDAEAYIHGYEGTNGFWASHRVLIVFGNIPRPEIRTPALLMPLADYRPTQPAVTMDPFIEIPTVETAETQDANRSTGQLDLLVCNALSPGAAGVATCQSVPNFSKDP